MSGGGLKFRTGQKRGWAFSPWQYGIEKQDQRSRRDHAPRRVDPTALLVESPEQLERARKVVAGFVEPVMIDRAAVVLCMLRNAHPSRVIKRSQVLERVQAGYPESTEGD